MIGWEIIEGKQFLSILHKTINSLRVFLSVSFYEEVDRLVGLFLAGSHPDVLNMRLGLTMKGFGKLVENISCLMEPTPLLSCLAIHLMQRIPKAKSPITHT